MKIFICTLVACILSSVSFADYVVISRNAYVYEQPDKNSRRIKKVFQGNKLELLNNDQVNGYFNVKLPNSNVVGWIYRSLVRRYEGYISDLLNKQELESEKVIVHVVDVGPGLCTVIELPNDKYIIYDAGHYRGGGETTLNQIKKIISPNAEIDLMVLSHTDADHIGAAGNIIRSYKVREILSTGYEKSMISNDKPTTSYKRLIEAIDEVNYKLKYVNLNELDSTIKPGIGFNYGNVKITFLCGFGKPPSDWDLKNNSERLNSVSIVMKLEYKGNSILFCGDAVGRHIESPPNTLIATEKFLVNNANKYLSSEIIIAGHHGAQNASTEALIEYVNPEAVIFSSGHLHDHPTKAAALRFLKVVDINNVFRTDRGDDEREKDKPYYEWDYGKVDGCVDPYGDDNIEIVLKSNGTYQISYQNINPPCQIGSISTN